MELSPFLQFLADYGYWIAVPIMILEGPFITIIMGFFASLGLFDIYVVITLSVISDLFSDTFYYAIGRHAGPPILSRFKVPGGTDHENLQKLRQRFERYPGRIFFTAKVLTGIAHSTFALAGVVKYSYKKVLPYSIPGGIIWSAALGMLGFYFGWQATNISRFLSSAGLVLFGLLVLFLFYEFYLGKRLARKFVVWRSRYNSFFNANKSQRKIQGRSIHPSR